MAKILLADDSVTIQKVVEVILSKEGHSLKVVSSGEDALIALASYSPDLILADVVMPGISGYQLTQEIRRNPATRDIPVILLAGAFEPIDHDLAKGSGANDSIIKPFETEELLRKINALLAQAAVAEEAVEAEAVVEAEEAFLAEEPLEAEAGLLDLTEAYEETAGVEIAEEAVEEAEALVAEAVEAEPAMAAMEAEPFVGPRSVTPQPTTAKEVAVPTAAEISETVRQAVNERLAESMRSVDLSGILGRMVDAKLTELINNTDLTELLKGAIESKLAESMKPGVMNEMLLDVMKSAVKASVEKAFAESLPALAEKLLREQVEAAMGSVRKEIENVIWETVPDISEALVAKELERIRAEG